ncbi:uncharacterized protein M6B38_185650 [Iris pallida]|uniref:Uncharacterized protein n=1 Tax=Iris pallida TaxID=29817 RepID=A0AAX6EJF4_IRIPA|nr:uncharacterized protein M6B38_185650 [Iris pallida]
MPPNSINGFGKPNPFPNATKLYRLTRDHRIYHFSLPLPTHQSPSSRWPSSSRSATPALTVTLLNTPLNIQSLQSSNVLHPSNVHLKSLPYRGTDFGLPPGVENTDSLPLPSIIRIFDSSESFQPHFVHFLSELTRENNGQPPLLIIADVFRDGRSTSPGASTYRTPASPRAGPSGLRPTCPSGSTCRMLQHLPARRNSTSRAFPRLSSCRRTRCPVTCVLPTAATPGRGSSGGRSRGRCGRTRSCATQSRRSRPRG